MAAKESCSQGLPPGQFCVNQKWICLSVPATLCHPVGDASRKCVLHANVTVTFRVQLTPLVMAPITDVCEAQSHGHYTHSDSNPSSTAYQPCDLPCTRYPLGANCLPVCKMGLIVVVTAQKNVSKISQHRDFPGGPVVQTLHFHCREHRLDPQAVS